MRRIFAIIKKELRRFFCDRRMLMALFLPGIIIFLVYYFVPDIYGASFASNYDSSYEAKIAISDNYNLREDTPSLIETAINDNFNKLGYEVPIFSEFKISEENTIIDELKLGNVDLVIIFTDDFENLIFDPTISSKPNIKIYYNSASKESTYLYSFTYALADSIYSSYGINDDIVPDVSDKNYQALQVIAIILPMLTISMIFSTTLQVCPEAIAGEKERGTLSALLVTPLKRSELAIGKILSLIIVSLVSGVVSSLGLILSLPRLLGNDSLTTLGAGAYILLFLAIISVVILFVNIAMCVSTFAKSTKEATSYLGPLLLIFMVVAMLPGILDCSNIGFAFVPILNISQVMSSIIYGAIDVTYLLLSFFTNIVLSCAFVLIDVKLFNIESIVMRQ